MTEEEFADRTRSMIEHENSLRDQRLNWLIAFQGLLIAALGFFWDKDKHPVMALPMVGLLSCVSIGANLFCNALTIRNLADKWNKRARPDYDGPPVVGLRSEEVIPRFVTKLYPWHVLPISLSVFWIFVLFYKAWS